MVARIAAAIAAIVVPLSTRNADGGPLLLLASAFTAPCCRLSSPIVRQQRGQQSTSSSGTLTSLSAGKGFGDKPTTPAKQKSPPPVSSSSPSSSSSVETTVAPSPSAGEGGEDDAPSSSKGDSAGSELLRQLRSREAEKRDAEIRKLRDLREADALLAEDAGAAVIPERVAQRMGSRMLPFVGIPLFGSFASFIGFWYLATYKDQEFQPAIVATTSIGFLVVGLLGITYSLLSASWDDDREGSGLGVEEFQKNVGSLREGLSRTRENALLREKMVGLSEEEIQRAIDGQNKREKAKNKKDAWMK